MKNRPFLDKIFFSFLPRRNKEKLLLGWLGRLDILLQSGCSLYSALDTLCRDNNLKLYNEVTLDIREELIKGNPLSKSFEIHTAYFGQLYLYVGAGEDSGNLTEVIHRVVEMYKSFYALRMPIYHPFLNSSWLQIGLQRLTGETKAEKEINAYIVRCVKLLGEGKTPEFHFEEWYSDAEMKPKGRTMLQTEDGITMERELSIETCRQYIVSLCSRSGLPYWSKNKQLKTMELMVEGHEFVFEVCIMLSPFGRTLKLKPQNKH